MNENQILFLMMLSVGGMTFARTYLQELSLEDGDATIKGLTAAGLIVRQPAKGPAVYLLTNAGSLAFDAMKVAAERGSAPPAPQRRAMDNMLLKAATDAHTALDVVMAERARESQSYRPTQDPVFNVVVALHHAILVEEGREPAS